MTESSNLIDACRDRLTLADCPAVPAGTVLAPGGVYLDLAVFGGAPFVALRGQMAGSRTRYVARRDVAVERWHALVSGSHRGVPGPDAEPRPD